MTVPIWHAIVSNKSKPLSSFRNISTGDHNVNIYI